MNLLNSCIEKKIKQIILISSINVYGESLNIPSKENDPLNPISSYGQIKMITEQIYKHFSEMYDIFCNQDGEFTNFVWNLSYWTLSPWGVKMTSMGYNRKTWYKKMKFFYFKTSHLNLSFLKIIVVYCSNTHSKKMRTLVKFLQKSVKTLIAHNFFRTNREK